MPDSITLLCIPFSRRPKISDVFSVDIGTQASVGDLKQVIKNQRPGLYGEFEINGLKLYDAAKLKDPIYIDDDEALDGDSSFVKQVFQAYEDRPLRARQTVSTIFSGQPDPSRLHIVIKCPMFLRLFCILETESPAMEDLIDVDIRDTLQVADLRRAIMKEISESERLPVYSFVLWRISLPYETNLNTILKDGDRSTLNPADETPLSEIFHSAHIEYLHVIVQIQIKPISRSDNIPTPLLHPANDLPTHKAMSSKSSRGDVGLQRRLYNIETPPKPPSEEGQPKKYASHQYKPAQQILCNRPRSAMSTIPVTLLHPIFGQFLDDCKNLPAEASDNAFALELSVAMSDFYDDEKSRANVVRQVFHDHGLHFIVSNTPNGFITDGDINVNGYRYAIAEFKNEVGSTGVEPYAQASLYYRDCTRDAAPKISDTPLPCLILLLFGPYLAFAGAAWNLRPIQQTLSTVLPLHYHPSDTDMRTMLARHLAAFKRGVSSLDEYYRKLSTSVATSPTRTRRQLFPYPTSFRNNGSTTLHSFEYIKQISGDKLLFLATMNQTGEKICVKFAREYSVNTHLFCAQHGFAPALRYYERIPGDWKMIIMDAIDDHVELCDSRLPGLHSIFEKIKEKLIELHQHSFVHGDIRDTNIMISKDKKSFMLVDFDWAGENGKVTYPMNVNREDIWRPDGAEDGKLITADHDMAMLNYIMEKNGVQVDVER